MSGGVGGEASQDALLFRFVRRRAPRAGATPPAGGEGDEGYDTRLAGAAGVY